MFGYEAGVCIRFSPGFPNSEQPLLSAGVMAKRPPKAAISPSTINEHLGRRVKKLRTDRGWSLDNLAQASGVSRSMLSEIEREKANPTLAVTFRISSAFAMTIAELIESSEKQ